MAAHVQKSKRARAFICLGQLSVTQQPGLLAFLTGLSTNDCWVSPSYFVTVHSLSNRESPATMLKSHRRDPRRLLMFYGQEKVEGVNWLPITDGAWLRRAASQPWGASPGKDPASRDFPPLLKPNRM